MYIPTYVTGYIEVFIKVLPPFVDYLPQPSLLPGKLLVQRIQVCAHNIIGVSLSEPHVNSTAQREYDLYTCNMVHQSLVISFRMLF